MIATTLFGLEETLANELHDLGASEIELLNRAVIFSGDKALLYKCNLHLRTALKVLKPFAQFELRDEEDLYKKIKSIDWSEFMSVDGTLAVDATVNGETFTHSQFVALKSKDAVVDQFREKYGRRPNVELDNPDLKINVHIRNRECSVSLDSSGVSLGKRGYRKAQSLAPLSEVLAAGMISLMNWNGKNDFRDPMCGSGTLSIEAAMIASNMAPGHLRHFTFENWLDFDADLWKTIKQEAKDQIVAPKVKIYASDMDSRSVLIAESNAENAGVNQWIEFKEADFLDPEVNFSDSTILMNPPYGERMRDKDDIIPFYQEIGTQLKHHYNGCEAWVLSSNIEALKFIGLRPSRKIRLFNGPLECKLQKYELFRGKKSERYEEK
jgi:putative N6-adenine-specific DNA methylase